MKLYRVINIVLIGTGLTFSNANAQDDAALFIKNIHSTALTQGKSYTLLRQLCTQFPKRIAGSDAYLGASKWGKEALDSLKGVNASLQDCEANYWIRGKTEALQLELSNGKKIAVPCLALGGSPNSPPTGVNGRIIEVKSLDELNALGKDKVQGKIVFFNRPMDPTSIRTFTGYGGAVDQRVYGPATASTLGALGCIVRSMSILIDDTPHTGTTFFADTIAKIPAISISTKDAEALASNLKKEAVRATIITHCQNGGLRSAPTVIGEIKGSEYPEEIILIGGHLDSWDVGEGAHDDGAGCAQSIDVLHIFNTLGYKPKRTIRVVLFSNEENGLAGGLTYAKVSNQKNEFHLASIESDAGGFSPRGFSFDAHESKFIEYYRKVNEWLPLLEPYGLIFEKGGSGADIGPLKSQQGLLVGLRPDSQRYFDYHHTEADVFSTVHPRELCLGAAAMASLVYLIDQNGL